LHIYISRSNIW